MKPKKKRVSVTLDADLIEEVKNLAENDERSFSQYINMIVREHLTVKKGSSDMMYFRL